MSLSRIITLEKQVALLQEKLDGLTERMARVEGVNEITEIPQLVTVGSGSDSGEHSSKPTVVVSKPVAKRKPVAKKSTK